MENASEALIMAFSVIVFVLALSISIYAFGEARVTSELIMQRSDVTYDQTYTKSDKNLLKRVNISNSKSGEKQLVTRTVGAETIIPTLYRAYKENIVVIFAESQPSYFNKGIFAQKVNGDFPTEITLNNNTIDFQKLNIGSENRATEFITYMLHSTKDNDFLTGKFMQGGSQNYKSLMNTNCLYDIIKDNKFNELVGVYYMEDLDDYENNEFNNLYNSSNLKEPEISDANKTKRRVITYVLNNK